MKDLYLAYKKFDSFIKMQFIVIFVISLSWALILPLITKLQGMLWTTSIISAFLIIQRLTSFVSPFFKNANLVISYRNLIILDLLYFISLYSFFISPLYFIYIEGTLMLVYTVIMSVFSIKYDAFLMKRYNTETFENVQYIERMIMSAAAICGYFVVIVLDIFSEDMTATIITFYYILGINLLFQFYNYFFFWKKSKIN